MYRYFKLIDQPLKLSYDDIKKYSKLSKYQQTEFFKEKSPSQLDELMLRFDPNKKQYNFITCVQNPKEKEFKCRIIESVRLIIRAREEIRTTLLEMMELRRTIIKSKIFSDTQIVRGLLSEMKNSHFDASPYEALNLRCKPGEIEIDLYSDKILGPFIKKYMKKADATSRFPFEIYLY